MRSNLIATNLIYLLLLVVNVFTFSRNSLASQNLPFTAVIAVANSESFDNSLPTLRFATRDLERVIEVLQKTAHVTPTYTLKLINPPRKTFRKAFKEMIQAIQKEKANSQQAKFIFYFTGHSDVTGLHFIDGLLSKQELHALLKEFPTKTKISFLDSCYSGALAEKGLKVTEAFQVPKIEIDQPTGSVFLAATSATDLAFEINELEGSLFTHHLVSGLYGQADQNQDGFITLDELYQFVYQQMQLFSLTLPVTARQKPEYQLDLKGQGLLILSYVKEATGVVHLNRDIYGELTFSPLNGIKVFHITKSNQDELKMRLPKGSYQTILKNDRHIGKAILVVNKEHPANLKLENFQLVENDNLKFITKGKKQQLSYGAKLGAHLGMKNILSGGPFVETFLASKSLTVYNLHLRGMGLLGFHRNATISQSESEDIDILSLLVALQTTYFLDFALRTLPIHMIFGAGESIVYRNHQSITWDSHNLVDEIPKITFGIESSYILNEHYSLGWQFRREFYFAQDKNTKDVLALAANIVTLSLEF